MKKSLTLALVAVLVFSLAGAAFAFSDTTGVDSWAGKQITKLVEMGVIEGTGDGKYSPNTTLTRAQFAKMLVKAKSIATVSPTTPTFSDVNKGDWFYEYVEAAAAAKLMEGPGNGKFLPNQPITREEVAKLVVLAAGKTADTAKAINFDDKASVSEWAKGFVAVAADLKLMQGSNNKFDPKGTTTRAQAAVLLYNEMVYDKKIVVETVVDTSLISDINRNAATGEISTLTIGGKVLDVDNDTNNNDDVIYVGDQEVNGFAVRKNTHATNETNGKGDKILKLKLDPTEYKFAKGRVTQKALEGSQWYVVIDGTKILFDTSKSDYTMNIKDSDGEIAYQGTGAPQMDASYFVIFDANNQSYFWLNLDEVDLKDKVGSVGKEGTKYYLEIAGKKYFVGTDNRLEFDGAPVTISDSAPTAWYNSLVGKYVEITLNSDGTLKTVSRLDTKKGFVIGRPIFVNQTGNTNDGPWDVYVKVAAQSGNAYTDGDTDGNIDYFYVHLNSVNYYTTSTDIPDNFDVANQVAPADVTPGDVELYRNAYVSIDGTGKKLGDVQEGDFLAVNYTDSQYKSVTAYRNSAKGIIEDFIVDNNNFVTSVKISGKTYKYIGASAKNTSSTKGEMVVGFGAPVTVEEGWVATAAVNSYGEIVALTSAEKPQVKDGLVVGLPGDKSKATKSDASNTLYIPANVIEVEYTTGGVKKLAWVNLQYSDTDGADANNGELNGGEMYVTYVVKGNEYKTFGDIKVGDTVSVLTAGNAAPQNYNKEITTKYLRTTQDVGSSIGTLDLNAAAAVGNPFSDGTLAYNNANGSWNWVLEGKDSPDVAWGDAANTWFNFTSTPADYIVIK